MAGHGVAKAGEVEQGCRTQLDCVAARTRGCVVGGEARVVWEVVLQVGVALLSAWVAHGGSRRHWIGRGRGRKIVAGQRQEVSRGVAGGGGRSHQPVGLN